jgi:fumarate reductase subunit C
MSPPGRPKGEYRSAQHEGTPMSLQRSQSLLWLAQRGSAAVLALCVVVHLATMIVAVRGGLTAAEILGRTRGSIAWAAFYGVFVLGVAIHAPIGLRAIVAEMRGGHGKGIDMAMLAFAAVLLTLGLRAVWAVTAGMGT